MPVKSSNKSLNKLFSFTSSLKQKEYETNVHRLISSAQVILPNDDFKTCSSNPDFSINVDASVESNVLFIKMSNSKDFETWLQLAKCLHIWDLDARGFHRGMWRMIYKDVMLFVVGYPFSDYS